MSVSIYPGLIVHVPMHVARLTMEVEHVTLAISVGADFENFVYSWLMFTWRPAERCCLLRFGGI